MIRIFLIALLALNACSGSSSHGAPPIGDGCGVQSPCTSTGDSTSTSAASSSTGLDDECAAFEGCVDACSGDSCPEACASAADVVLEVCMRRRCDRLRLECGNGSPEACADLLDCGERSDSTGRSDARTDSSGEATETDTGSGSSGSSSSSGSSESGSSSSSESSSLGSSDGTSSDG